MINGGLQLVISNDSDFDVGGVTGTGAGGGAPYLLNAKINSEGVLDDGEYLIVNMARLPAVGSTATVTFTVLADVSSQTQRLGYRRRGQPRDRQLHQHPYRQEHQQFRDSRRVPDSA